MAQLRLCCGAHGTLQGHFEVFTAWDFGPTNHAPTATFTLVECSTDKKSRFGARRNQSRVLRLAAERSV